MGRENAPSRLSKAAARAELLSRGYQPEQLDSLRLKELTDMVSAARAAERGEKREKMIPEPPPAKRPEEEENKAGLPAKTIPTPTFTCTTGCPTYLRARNWYIIHS